MVFTILTLEFIHITFHAISIIAKSKAFMLLTFFICRFFFVRAGMLGWLIINLSVLGKSIQDGELHRSMVLYQLFCTV